MAQQLMAQVGLWGVGWVGWVPDELQQTGTACQPGRLVCMQAMPWSRSADQAGGSAESSMRHICRGAMWVTSAAGSGCRSRWSCQRLQVHDSAVFFEVSAWRWSGQNITWVLWKHLKARPFRKSRGCSSPATGRICQPVFCLQHRKAQLSERLCIAGCHSTHDAHPLVAGSRAGRVRCKPAVGILERTQTGHVLAEPFTAPSLPHRQLRLFQHRPGVTTVLDQHPPHAASP